jgi:hypothetical protein
MTLVNFYEVCDKQGNAVWGGVSTLQAVEWLAREADYRLYVSVWSEDDPEEPVLITDKINITDVVLATRLNERDNK